MEISKFVRFNRYLSSVSLQLLMVYPNTRLSWFTRQLDLELMFTSTISLHMANWIKWEVIHRFSDIIYWLNLFIGFIYWHYLVALLIQWLYLFCWMAVYWTYLLDLFYGFTYSLTLCIRFGGFIYTPYLWTLVSAHTVFMLIANLVSFSHISERNTNKFPSIYISHVLMEKIFCSTLRHHLCLIKLPLLQLHQQTLLIKLTYVA